MIEERLSRPQKVGLDLVEVRSAYEDLQRPTEVYVKFAVVLEEASVVREEVRRSRALVSVAFESWEARWLFEQSSWPERRAVACYQCHLRYRHRLLHLM